MRMHGIFREKNNKLPRVFLCVGICALKKGEHIGSGRDIHVFEEKAGAGNEEKRKESSYSSDSSVSTWRSEIMKLQLFPRISTHVQVPPLFFLLLFWNKREEALPPLLVFWVIIGREAIQFRFRLLFALWRQLNAFPQNMRRCYNNVPLFPANLERNIRNARPKKMGGNDT